MDFDQPGIYRVKLTVVDLYNNESEVIKFVNVKDTGEVTIVSDLKADFIATPPISPEDGAIHLQGDFDEVSFDFRNSTGYIRKYVFDNNVYVDTSDNDRNADDEDYVTSTPGIYTTTFNPEAEKIKVRLTVYGQGSAIDIKEVEVIFDKGLDDLEANMFNSFNGQIPSILVSMLLFGIISISLYQLSLKEK